MAVAARIFSGRQKAGPARRRRNGSRSVQGIKPAGVSESPSCENRRASPGNQAHADGGRPGLNRQAQTHRLEDGRQAAECRIAPDTAVLSRLRKPAAGPTHAAHGLRPENSISSDQGAIGRYSSRRVRAVIPEQLGHRIVMGRILIRRLFVASPANTPPPACPILCACRHRTAATPADGQPARSTPGSAWPGVARPSDTPSR